MGKNTVHLLEHQKYVWKLNVDPTDKVGETRTNKMVWIIDTENNHYFDSRICYYFDNLYAFDAMNQKEKADRNDQHTANMNQNHR